MKPKLASKKVPLTVKYKVGEHLDNLEQKYGKSRIRNEVGYLEDFVDPNDYDFKCILKFRRKNNVDDQSRKRSNKNDGQKHRSRVSPHKRMSANWYKIMDLIMAGHAYKYIAERIGVSEGALRYFIYTHHELDVLYRSTAERRKPVTGVEVGRIKKLLKKGLTHQQIADRMEITKNQVDWQIQKIRDKERGRR